MLFVKDKELETWVSTMNRSFGCTKFAVQFQFLSSLASLDPFGPFTHYIFEDLFYHFEIPVRINLPIRSRDPACRRIIPYCSRRINLRARIDSLNQLFVQPPVFSLEEYNDEDILIDSIPRSEDISRKKFECIMIIKVCGDCASKTNLSLQYVPVPFASVSHESGVDRQASEAPGVLDANV